MAPGRLLIVVGVALVVLGLGVNLGLGRLLGGLGRLPGDIRWEGKNGGFYFPIVTCLLVSAVLSLVLWIVSRFR